MDRGTLESIVKPWWLTPPAFLAVMILLAVGVGGYIAMCWYIEGLFLKWARLGW